MGMRYVRGDGRVGDHSYPCCDCHKRTTGVSAVFEIDEEKDAQGNVVKLKIRTFCTECSVAHTTALVQ